MIAMRCARSGCKPMFIIIRNMAIDMCCRSCNAMAKSQMERIWQLEGLQLPRRHTVKSRYSDPQGLEQAATHSNHIGSYDFASHATERGTHFRVLSIIDEYTREA